MVNCTLCPRRCGANRDENIGVCGADNRLKIARAAAHFWEEPCISGKNGSGAIFFFGLHFALRLLPELRNFIGRQGRFRERRGLCFDSVFA